MRIKFQNTGRRFDHTWAIRNVTAQMEPGTIVAVLGANGAGKTTLLRLLAGWLPVSAGAILCDESPMRPTATGLRRRVMLLEDAPRWEETPLQMIAQRLEDHNAFREGIEDEVADWFDRLSVTPFYRNDMRRMSKGQRYKVAMTSLFVVAPELWLLDEPFSAGLDAVGLLALETRMQQHRKSGGTVVFSSQWPEHARRLANHVLVLHSGALVWDAPTSRTVPPRRMASSDASLQAVLRGLVV